jgi:hypothetical protein
LKDSDSINTLNFKNILQYRFVFDGRSPFALSEFSQICRKNLDCLLNIK